MGRIRLFIFSILGLFSYYRNKVQSPIVLFWHDVANNPNSLVEGESFRTFLFVKQIKYLMRHYEIISMDEFFTRYQTHSFSNREVVLTFDDGYKNNLLIVAPILKKFNLPFTVFISANNIEKQERFYVSIPRLVIIGAKLIHVDIPELSYSKECRTDAERIICANEIEYKIKYLSHKEAVSISKRLINYIGVDKYCQLLSEYPNGALLKWDGVKELAQNYNCTIGSHSMDHCVCHSKQDDELVRQQIVESKQLIEERTSQKCVYFAYPNGDHTEFSDELVLQNYKMGFTTERKPIYSEKNIATIGRVAVPSSMLIFKYSITMGLYKVFQNHNK